MSVSFAIADRPKGAEFVAYDCAACGHEELGRPVFLRPLAGGNVIAVGTGCAAKLLGLPVAEVAATLAVAELVELAAADHKVCNVWADFAACLPGRVTDKWNRDEVARHRIAPELAARIGELYKAVHKVGRVREVHAAIAR